MHVDVYGLFRIDVVGCRGTGRQENKAKGAVILTQDVFSNDINSQKKKEIWTDEMRGQKHKKNRQHHKNNCVTHHHNNFQARNAKEPNDGGD